MFAGREEAAPTVRFRCVFNWDVEQIVLYWSCGEQSPCYL